MRLIRLLVAVALAIVGMLGGSAAPVAAWALPDAPASSCAYNASQQTAVAVFATTERGPPSRYDRPAACPAADQWSSGTSQRSAASTTYAYTDYDRPLRSAQDAIGTGAAPESARVADVPSADFHRAGVAAKTGTAGAEDVLNGVRLRAQLTGQEISGGHAFEKHILDLGEFPGIRTRAQFASHIEDVVLNGEMRALGGGRTAFWRDGTVVIRNPRAPDGGTAFQPRDGCDYFLNQLH